MVPGLIVMPEVPVERLLQVLAILEGSEIDALVLDAAPEPFHEDVVMVAAFAVHADPDAMLFENTCEGLTGELGTLISIEDFRRSVALQGLLQGIDTEVCVHGVGDPPGQHLAAVPVDDSDKIHEAPGQRHVAYVSCPNLVRTLDLQALEQVRVHLVPIAWNAGSGARIHRLNAHGAHQPLHPFPVDPVALVLQVDPHLARAIVRRFQVLLINQVHQIQILLTLLTRDVVHR